MLGSCAARAASVDCGELYERLRRELVALVAGLDADALAVTVPATPAWRVRDVLAHVAGITSDLNAQRFDVDGDAWTRRQVEERRERDLAAIVAEWDAEAPQFAAGLRLFGYELGSHYVGDLHAHLQDIRSALGLPAARDGLAVQVALDFYLGSLDESLRRGPLGALEMIAAGEHHVAGAGKVRATLQADPFELLRALSGRRSRDQIRALDWSGDVDAFVEELSRYPLPARDIHD
jgi:uncharacterized protein (TIGR03083 family)